MSNKKENYLESIYLRLNRYIYPAFKDTPIIEITSGAILKLCRNIEARGTI